MTPSENHPKCKDARRSKAGGNIWLGDGFPDTFTAVHALFGAYEKAVGKYLRTGSPKTYLQVMKIWDKIQDELNNMNPCL